MAAQLGPPNNCLSKEDALTHLREIFAGQIDPDVVLMILAECDFNVNSALETLLALSQDATPTVTAVDVHVNRELQPHSSDVPTRLSPTTSNEYQFLLPSSFHPTIIASPDDTADKLRPFIDSTHHDDRLKHRGAATVTINTASQHFLTNGARPFNFRPTNGQRISTIYKSNEALYFEDVANDHDFNCGVISPSAPSVESFQSLDVAVASSSAAQLNERRCQIRSAIVVQDARKCGRVTVDSVPSNGDRKVPTSLSELRDHLSPDSDRSIEADASESVSPDLQTTIGSELTDATVMASAGDKSFTRNYLQAGRYRATPNDIRTSYGSISVEMQAILNQNLSPQLRNALFNGDSASRTAATKQPRQQKLQPNQPRPNKRPSNNSGLGLLPNPFAASPAAVAQGKRPSPKEVVIGKIRRGEQVVIFLRGVPGSGKSTLARELASLDGSPTTGIVFSTDLYFTHGNTYCFDPEQLPAAHAKTRAMAVQAMRKQRSPIIIDNTNLQAWEMVPYAAAALQHRYIFWLMQPETPWRYDVAELARRNTHGIRADKIQRMLDRFERSVSFEKLKILALEYLQEKGLATKLPTGLLSVNRPAGMPTPNNVAHPPRSRSKSGHPLQNPLQSDTMVPRRGRPKSQHRKPQAQVVAQSHPMAVFAKPNFTSTVVNEPRGNFEDGNGQSAVDWDETLTWSTSSSDDEFSDCGSTQSSNFRGHPRQAETVLHKSKSVPNLVDCLNPKSGDPGGAGASGHRSRHPRGFFSPPDDSERREINLMLVNQDVGGGAHLLDDAEGWDGHGDDTVVMEPWPPISDNMKDLLTIDFNTAAAGEESSSATSVTSISTSPTTATTTTTEDLDFAGENIDQVVSDDASDKSDKYLFRQLKSSLKPNWDMPAYPGSSSIDLANPISSLLMSAERKSPLAQDKTGDDGAKVADGVKPSRHSNSDAEDLPNSQSRETHLGALKAFFGDISMVDLTDIFDNCNGDIHWTVNTLLDAGYVINSSSAVSGDGVEADNSGKVTAGRPPKSESSLEGLAELTLDDDEYGALLTGAAARPHGLVTSQSSDGEVSKVETLDHLPTPSLTSSSSWTSEAKTGDGGDRNVENVILRIDPFFAIQLERMFGPVGFHLEPACYIGDDLKVSIPREVARQIHASWDKSLQEKFQFEEYELKTMTTDEDFARQIQATEDTGSSLLFESDPTGQHFPQLEKQKLVYLLQQQAMPSKTENIASRIKRRQLYEMFPKIDPKSLDQVFEANEGSFSDTVIAIQDSYQPDEKPQLVIAPSQLEEYENALVKLAVQESLALSMEQAKGASKGVGETQQEMSYDDLRAEASVHYYLRQECFQKAREAYGKNMRSVASYYSQQGHLHTQKLSEANSRAAKNILELRNAGRNTKELDLHCLHVPEAMQALAAFMEEKKRELRSGSNPRIVVYIIAGRGNHSAMGMPRIKPAVIDYLIKHNYSFRETNGGQLEVIITRQIL